MVLTGDSRRTDSQICPSATLSTTNPTPIFLGLNTSLAQGQNKRDSGLILEYGTRMWREMYTKLCDSND